MGHAETRNLDHSLQCVVVLTEKWESTNGVMRTFERNGASENWRSRGPTIPVVVGKKGLGIGRGVVPLKMEGAPIKKEGDEKAPAGIFRLSSAFGYAPARSASWVKLPYLALTKSIEGVDDPSSRYYNQLVDRSRVRKVDWRSSEQMRRDNALHYKWGAVVDHNAAAIPGAGSCIFLHLWEGPSVPTTGCTAMAEKDLVSLLRWLDPRQRPVLVQMPRATYLALRPQYDLPLDRP